MARKTELKDKEKLFCEYFCETRNARSAAAKAGYGVMTARNAVKLINRKDIKSEIERLDRSRLISAQEIAAGYRQLAFGSVADALKLIYCDDNPTDIEKEKLELFNVSEIKRQKGGGIEIKFFDRMKALEHLELISKNGSDDEKALPFYRALEKSAEALKADFNE